MKNKTGSSSTKIGPRRAPARLLVGGLVPLVLAWIRGWVRQGLARLHRGGGKHKVHAARRPAHKPARQIDHPLVLHTGAQRQIELCHKGVGVALAHGFQTAAHVEAVSTQDVLVGLRSKVPVRGNPRALGLHHAATEQNEDSRCPGIFSRTLRFYYVANSPGSPLPVACLFLSFLGFEDPTNH